MATIICQGCGQAFGVPPGYTRNKIQCPGCGVICQVPADGGSSGPAAPPPRETPRSQAPAPALEDEAAAWLREPAPAPAPLPGPADDDPVLLQEVSPPADEPPLAQVAAALEDEPDIQGRKKGELLFTCRRCGTPIRRQRECPNCDAVDDTAVPLQTEPGTPAPVARPTPFVVAPHSLELDEPPLAGAVEEDEGPSPYGLADPLLPHCPKCHKEMPVGAVLCASCGFNLRTRKKVTRTYEPMSRSWESDMSLKTRLIWVGAFQGFHLFLTVCASLGEFATPFIVAWVPLTAILCFVLGTYEEIQLTRDTRGRVTLTQRWRCFFIPAAPKVTAVRGFASVLTGQWNDAGVFEWIVCLLLLFVGCLPALMWWYYAIYSNQYHVALAQLHGHADLYVFRGRNEQQMHDIAKALCEATGLRLA
jgi:hypothetical protein